MPHTKPMTPKQVRPCHHPATPPEPEGPCKSTQPADQNPLDQGSALSLRPNRDRLSQNVYPRTSLSGCPSSPALGGSKLALGRDQSILTNETLYPIVARPSRRTR